MSDLVQSCVRVSGLGRVGLLYDIDAHGKAKPNQCMTHCRAVAEQENFHLCHLEDIDPARLKMARKIYPIFECHSPEFALTIVSTPTYSHLETFLGLMERSRTHVVLMEKPAGISSTECLIMESVGLNLSIPIYVNYFRRYLSGTRKALQHLSELSPKRLLKLRLKCYGTLLNTFSHFIDLALCFLSDVELCICAKEMKLTHLGTFYFFCEKCLIEIEIVGLDALTNTCEVEMIFSDFRLLILESGKLFRIEMSDGSAYSHVNSDFEYNNYQKVVIEKVVNNSIEIKEFLGLSQAILVHRFIESMDFQNV